MSEETWRVLCEEGEVHYPVVVEAKGEPRSFFALTNEPDDDRSGWGEVPRLAVIDLARKMRWKVREILAPGELSAEERMVAAIRSYGSVLTETRGSLAEACDAAVAAERSRIRTACDAIRDRALAEAEREVRDLDEGLGPLDIRDSAVLKLAGTQHYALACGAIECADAIGYGAK